MSDKEEFRDKFKPDHLKRIFIRARNPETAEWENKSLQDLINEKRQGTILNWWGQYILRCFVENINEPETVTQKQIEAMIGFLYDIGVQPVRMLTEAEQREREAGVWKPK